MPAVLIEAGLCGLAAVSTPVGAIGDVVNDGYSGWMVPIGDQLALTAAMRRLVDDPELRERFGATARDRCMARFTIEVTAGDWLDLMGRLRRPSGTGKPSAQPPPPG